MNKFSKQYKDTQNRSSWITNKIDKLVSEGKPQNQAVAIAHSMWNSRKADGGSFYGDKPLKKMQDGPYPTRSMDGVIIPPSVYMNDTGYLDQRTSNDLLPGNPYDPNSTPQTASNGIYTPPKPQDPQGESGNNYYEQYFEEQKTKMPNQTGLQSARKPVKSVISEGLVPQGPTSDTKVNYGKGLNKDGNRNIDSYEGYDMKPQGRLIERDTRKINSEYTGEIDTDTNKEEKPPVNPYATTDLNSSFYNLGQAVEKGDGLGIAGFGAKSLLASGRNFMSGMGQARRRQEEDTEAGRKQREASSGVNNTRYVSGRGENGGQYNEYADGGQYDEYGYGGQKKMYQQGGEVDQDRILTGEVLTGVSGQNQAVEPNTEIEDGEYVLSNDGQSIKVEGKKHSQGGEDVELQDGDKVISDHLKLKGSNAKAVRDKFDVKVKAKDTYATVVDKVYKKIGLEKLIKEEEQVISKIRAQEEKLGEGATKDLNLQLLYSKKQKIEAEKQKLEEKRQEVLNEVYNMQEASKPKEEVPNQEMRDGGYYDSMEEGGEKEKFENWVQQLKELGYKPDPNKSYEEQIQDVQEWVANNNPEAVYKYFSEQPITSKGLSQIKESSPEVFEEAGISIPQNLAALTKEQRKKIQDTYKSKVDESSYNNFIIDQFKDGLFDFRAPLFKDSSENVDESGTPNPQGLDMDEFNETTRVTKDGVNTYQDPNSEGTGGEGDNGKGKNTKDKSKFQGYQGRPDQSVLPPSGVSAQTKINTRYDRVDPALMSPDQIIQENERKASAAIQAASQLPDAQRAAVIAQITAQTQAANQAVISQYDTQNNQIQNNAQAQNAQIQMNEENMAGQNALSFEKRQQTAESITDENVRQFLDYNRKANIQNFNDTRRQNTINRAFENFDLDAQGNVIGKGGYDIDYMSDLASQNGYSLVPASDTTDKKKKTTKKG